MKLLFKNYFEIILFVISLLMFIGIIKWGNYLIKTRKCGFKNEDKATIGGNQGFQNFSIDMGTPETNHNVNLPINTTYSCENICGPLARCSKTGEQCTSDVDCYGCQAKIFVPIYTTEEIGGQNDAGKLTGGITPQYSTLTTDIGTQAKFYGKGENLNPPSYFKGVNQWKKAFNTGMELFDKRYNPNINTLPYLPKYPKRKTLSGEFIDDGPLASNAYL